MSPFEVIIAGGGTGGHLSPGIALYEEFRNKGVKARFLCGAADTRFTSMKDIAAEDLFTYGAPQMTANLIKLPVFALEFAGAVMRARSIMKKTGARALIGMGGYVSAPALMAAKLRGIPIYLCEQNTVPGKVTVFFAKHAKKVFTTFEATEEYIKNELRPRLFPMGNPIRKKVLAPVDRESARKHFNLRHCPQVILAIGGSQGALTINELVLGLKKRFPEDFHNIGIIWSTGDYSYQSFKEAIQNLPKSGSVYISPFIDEVGMAYRACDIAISRSGSGVMVELAAMGVPSILVPFPFAAMDHQDKNADVFQDAGAAVKVANDDAVPEKVAPIILDILHNPTLLRKMSRKALDAAKVNAAADIAGAVIRDITAGKAV